MWTQNLFGKYKIQADEKCILLPLQLAFPAVGARLDNHSASLDVVEAWLFDHLGEEDELPA